MIRPMARSVSFTYLSCQVIHTFAVTPALGMMSPMLVAFDYRDGSGGFSRRKLWPIRSECTAEQTYLDGFCLVLRSRRRFRCDRMDRVSVDNVAVDEPEPFFAALAVPQEADTPFREISDAARDVWRDVDRIRQEHAVRDVVDALRDAMTDADVVAALERLRALVAARGFRQPEDIAAALVEQRLARRLERL